MNFHLRKHTSFKIGVLLLSSTFCSSVDSADLNRHSSCIIEITRTVSVNQAVLEVADARIELENWKLDQLKLLRKRGHATWLEVTRQQLVTDSLLRRRAASEEFRSFNQSILQRVLLASESVNQRSTTRPVRSAAPIKLRAPGSVRLVGWIELGQVPPEIHSLFTTRAQANSGQTNDDRQLTLARERLVCAERRCDVYASLESIAPQQLRQAELQRSLAQAEARLHQIEHDQRVNEIQQNSTLNVDADENVSKSKVVSLPIGTVEVYFTPRSNVKLGLATLWVAKCEANATSELEAARIASRRFKVRWESFQKLHANGHATHQELSDAREQLASAERQVEELQRQHTELTQSYHLIQESLQETGTDEYEQPGESRHAINPRGSSELVDEWPLSMMTDVQVVRHLIELRRSYFDSIAHRDGLLLKLAMLEEFWTKLKQSIADTPDSSLSAGSRRQLAGLELRIQYNHALRRAAQERLGILAAEEQRYMEQCVAQQQAENWLTADLPAQSALQLVSLIRSDEGRPTRISYLESDYLGRAENLRRCVLASISTDHPWSVFRDENVDPPRNSWTPYRSYTLVGRGTSARVGGQPSWLNRSRDTSVSDDSSRSNLRRERGSARPFPARKAYPFGNLDGDLRRQLKPGQHPWYLPGSSTNLKYR